MQEHERNQFIVEKLNEGFSLSDIQKMLEEEFNEVMTYMDLRILATELEGVDWSQQPEAKSPEKAKAEQEDILGQSGQGAAGGGTQVEISNVARPGAAMSGTVSFASGARAEWFLGQDGRLGLQPEPGSGKPTQEDIEEFQQELQKKLQSGGGM